MSKYSLEVRRIGGEGATWFHVGHFATMDAAARCYDRSYYTGTTSGRLVDRHTGVIQPIWDIDEALVVQRNEEEINADSSAMHGLMEFDQAIIEDLRNAYDARADRVRRLSGFDFVNIDHDEDEKAKKHKVEWWKDGF